MEKLTWTGRAMAWNDGDNLADLPRPVIHGYMEWNAYDPAAVRMTSYDPRTDEAVTWTFARDLLRDGIMAPVGYGDVTVYPAPTGRVAVRLSTPAGHCVITLDDPLSLRTWVRRTYAACPDTDELYARQVDRFLRRLGVGG